MRELTFLAAASAALVLPLPASAIPAKAPPPAFFNANPIAVTDSFSVKCYTFYSVIDVLANDSDPDGDPLTLVSATSNAGNVGVYANKLEYESFGPGSDTIIYTVEDGHGGTATGAVNVTITGYWWQCQEL